MRTCCNQPHDPLRLNTAPHHTELTQNHSRTPPEERRVPYNDPIPQYELYTPVAYAYPQQPGFLITLPQHVKQAWCPYPPSVYPTFQQVPSLTPVPCSMQHGVEGRGIQLPPPKQGNVLPSIRDVFPFITFPHNRM